VLTKDNYYIIFCIFACIFITRTLEIKTKTITYTSIITKTHFFETPPAMCKNANFRFYDVSFIFVTAVKQHMELFLFTKGLEIPPFYVSRVAFLSSFIYALRKLWHFVMRMNE